MYPSRPSSSDPNAPYRATTPTLIDFFAKEREEHQERADANHQQNPLSALGPRRTTHGTAPSATANVGPSAAPNVTASTIGQYLSERGYAVNILLRNETIEARLSSARLSAEALLAALHIAHDAHHPLLARLGVSDKNRALLLYWLAGIANNKQGFLQPIRTAALNANNNPDQLINNILQYIEARK